MAVKSTKDHVTVGIVGGGIGGLALAKMLEMSGVSYKLFEAHELVPLVGASIGLLPSGLRILDQIGAIDGIDKWSVEHDQWEHRDGATGKLYAKSKAVRVFPEIFGYGAFFLERQHILKSLYDSFRDKSPLHAHKRVIDIQSFKDCCTIKSADGDSFSCQIVAGADGVHSVVRKFIREMQPSPAPTLAPNYLSAETYCIFGISSPLEQIRRGRCFTIYQRDASIIAFTGLNGKFFWFIFKKFDEPLRYGERRKYSQDNIDAAYRVVKDAVMTDGVLFSDIYDRVEHSITLTVEQGVCEIFHAGRMFLLGDASHKMAPQGGMGANSALESAACFVNNLDRLKLAHSDPDTARATLEQVEQVLRAYAEQRRDRVTGLMELAAWSQRVQLRTGPDSEKFIDGLPHMKEYDWAIKPVLSQSRAEKLENWPYNSQRVLRYSKNAERALDAERRGTERELLEAVLTKLGLK